MNKKFSKLKKKHQVIYALFVGFGAVSVWRGFWGIMDVYVFPEDYLHSSIASIVIGVVILISTHHLSKEFL